MAYLGGGPLRLAPLSTDHNFYDGIYGCFTNFFLLKHQNLGITPGPPPFAHSKYATDYVHKPIAQQSAVVVAAAT